MKKLLFLTVLSLVISASVLAADEDDELYNNKAVTLDKSQRVFRVNLPSNPTTGFSWFLKDYDDRLIEPVKHQFTAAQGGQVGVGGVDTWTFKANRTAFDVPHLTQISFIYAQPWNMESASDNVITVVTH
jgi:inhibitor of cysteine peptidase